MMINPVPNIAAYAAPADQVLIRIVGDEIVRIPIRVELAALRDQLEAAPAGDPRVRSIVAWHSGFSRVLRHPDLQGAIKEYVKVLVGLLRDPSGPDGVERPFPAELFGNGPMPVIRYIVEKMRDKRSLFYSEEFDQEAIRVLNAVHPDVMEVRAVVQHNGPAQNIPNIPPELLGQLRQIEANNARQIQAEAQGMDGLRALQERVRQRQVAWREDVNRVAQQHLAEVQRIGEEAERIRVLDREQRAIMLRAANHLGQEAENLRAEVVRLQRHIDVNREQAGELERANIQLQIEINNVRAQIADNKSNWLLDVVCIVASVAISWTVQMPIVILPPK